MVFRFEGGLHGPKDVVSLEQACPWPNRPGVDSIYQLLQQTAAAYPDAYALSYYPTGDPDDEPVRLSYRRFLGAVTAAANLFRAQGISEGDVVSLLLPNLPQTQIALWGATAAGIANPINFLLQVDQLEALLRATDSKVLVALGPNPMLPIWDKVTELRRRLPHLKILRVGPGEPEEGVRDFDRAIAQHPPDALQSPRTIKRSDGAIAFHTGGTTGMPKIAVRSQENDLYCAWVTAQLAALQPGDRLMGALPLFHVGGAIVCSLAALATGGEIIMPSAVGLRHPNALARHWKLIEKCSATHIGAVPTSLVALMDVPVGDADISSVKYVLTGGSSLPVEVERNWKARFGIKISQLYGMTEAGVNIAAAPVHYQPPLGAAGIRLPYGEWKIVKDPVNYPFEECPVGVKGVVVYRGPGVFGGYLDATQNQAVLAPDGWLITGDMGYRDEDHHLFITGRSKDLIIRGAHNIDPAMIEEALVTHPAVALAAAVGKPDAYAGELPVAYVSLAPGAETTPEELKTYLEGCIAERPALPKEIHILDQIPMTAVGKIFKPVLRWKLAESVCAEALAGLAEQGLNFTVKAGEDKKHGILVKVSIQASENRSDVENEIKSLLGRFLLGFEINWE